MRLFVGVVPPPQVAEHLDAFLEVRRAAAPFRWTLPEQWHITLAFAAEAPERTFDEVSERLAGAAARRKPFELRVGGGGAFPDPARARVLYAGVTGAERLAHLATGARSALAKSGVQIDGQRFRPHLTLARLGHPEEVSNWVRLLDAYDGPEWVVDELTLIQSHLGEGPRRRPRYEVLSVFPLG